ncbi:MAG: anthranilate phosphoribosyltransferase [Candidatus Methanomethylophilaceae archaeon]|nr:anthranilate phosphoribosyltransferase [Candidatus Methanomethylophilaceae archaeon]
MIREAVMRLVEGRDLGYLEAQAVMDEMMTGKASDIQTSAFLAALAAKGETVDEITAFAVSMRSHGVKLPGMTEAVEIVGTGGDRSGSFNISTASSFVVSAAGAPVAKHGNRAANSRCGAADVLEALGADITIGPGKSARILEEIGICFMFAQDYHAAMRHVAPVRRELGIRTVFNILGPLTNPAAARMQLMGVYDGSLLEPLARVMSNLGVEKGMTVHGADGLDEISVCAPTSVCEIRNGTIMDYTIEPEKLGIRLCSEGDIAGGGPEENARIIREVLGGERGPRRDIVLLNSAAALYIADRCGSVSGGLTLAAAAIDSGRASERLERFVDMTRF